MLRETVSVSERAKLYRVAAKLGGAAAPLVLVLGCASPAVSPSYDAATRRLWRIDSDTNRDGAVDHRAYMDGNVPMRAEIDQDGDGRVDRWEYFSGAVLVGVGTSTARDGIEDTWTWAEDAGGERRVDLSLLRDRAIDRREYFRADTLVRAEADTNADGRIDRWETFAGSTIAEVALDTTLAADRPNRRLTYDRDGRFRFIEIDPDGDGQWEQVK